MPHIHTGDGEFDFTVSGYLVYKNKTLLIKHKTLPLWVPPSGHIEPSQTPIDALFTEIQEEAGITKSHLTLVPTHPYTGRHTRASSSTELALPFDLETHSITKAHGHINLSYALISDTDNVEPGPGESNTFKWFTLDELAHFSDTNDSVKSAAIYAIEAAGEYKS